MSYIKGLNKYHYRRILYLKRKWHNVERKKQLEKQGYVFIDIKNFKRLRQYDHSKQFIWDDTQKTQHISKHNDKMLTTTQLKMNGNNHNHNKKRKLKIANNHDQQPLKRQKKKM